MAILLLLVHSHGISAPIIIFMSRRCTPGGAPGAESLGGRSGARGPTGGLESLGRVKLDTAARERPGGQPEFVRDAGHGRYNRCYGVLSVPRWLSCQSRPGDSGSGWLQPDHRGHGHSVTGTVYSHRDWQAGPGTPAGPAGSESESPWHRAGCTD